MPLLMSSKYDEFGRPTIAPPEFTEGLSAPPLNYASKYTAGMPAPPPSFVASAPSALPMPPPAAPSPRASFLPQPLAAPPPQPMTSPVQQTPVPTFDPILPRPESPLDTLRFKHAAEMPTSDQFKQSKLRTVLNAIAGGLAGASGGPKVGAEVGTLLHEGPYMRAVRDWQMRDKNLESQQEQESKRWATGVAASGVGARQSAVAASVNNANVTATQAGQRLNLDAWRAFTDQQVKYATANKPTPEEFKASMMASKDPAIAAVVNKMYEDHSPEGILASALARGRGANTATMELAADPAYQQNVLETAGSKVATEETARQRAQQTPEAIAGAAAREGAIAEARENAKGRAALDPGILARAKQISEDNPENVLTFMATLPKEQQMALWRLPQKEFATPPNVPIAGRNLLATARTTLGHVDVMSGMIENPYIKANLKALSGRMQVLRSKVGGEFFDASGNSMGSPRPGVTEIETVALRPEKIKPGMPAKTAEQAEIEQKFITYMNYLVIWESRTATGSGRPAQKLIEMMKASSPQHYMGYNQIRGALSGIESSAQQQVDGILALTRGGSVTSPKKKPGDVAAPSDDGITIGPVRR